MSIRIAFIGAGRMATAIVRRLLKHGHYNAKEIVLLLSITQMLMLGSRWPLYKPEADLFKNGTAHQEIKRHSPDIVVNAAAYTAVDKAESESSCIL